MASLPCATSRHYPPGIHFAIQDGEFPPGHSCQEARVCSKTQDSSQYTLFPGLFGAAITTVCALEIAHTGYVEATAAETGLVDGVTILASPTAAGCKFTQKEYRDGNRSLSHA